MKRDRGAGIVIKGDEVLLMRRVSAGEEYYTFPGGGPEDCETIEETAVREIREETSIVAKPTKLAYRIAWDDGSTHSYLICDYVSGEPKLEESSVEQALVDAGSEVYDPMWVPLDRMKDLIVYPLEVRDLFLKDRAEGFADEVRELSIVFADRRQGPKAPKKR